MRRLENYNGLLTMQPMFPWAGAHDDCVLIHTIDHQNNGKLTFARLQFMFEYTVGNEPLRLALVTPFYIPPGEKRAIDKDLRLIRLCARSVASSQIITLRSII